MRINLRPALLATFIFLAGLAAWLAYRAGVAHPKSTTPEPQSAPVASILIPGIAEPPEMRVLPFPAPVVTPQMRMLYDAMQQADSKTEPNARRTAVDRIIAKYPDYSDAYMMRLSLLCDGSDRAAILSDINNALKYMSNSVTGNDSLNSMISMRAKIEHTNGDDSAAMEDLDKAINTKLADATQFVNSGATSPERSASACTWTLPDMDALVQRFPHDSRAYLFRGLYYGFFVMWDQNSLQPAIENLRRAGEMDTHSALPHFFIAHMQNRPIAVLGLQGAQRDIFNRSRLQELTAALTLDPNLLPALGDRAEAYFELNQFPEAIADYDKIVTLNPTDAGAYNDCALAKMQLGNNYAAISDFDKAIANKKRELNNSNSYESRADAYMKTQQWGLAIDDLSTAISLQIGGVVILSNVKQFRALYPEYKTASDEAIAQKLNRTFYPNMKYEDFSKGFLHGDKAWESTVVPDLYLKRSDAYLKAGDWHNATLDYRRAVDGFPSYAGAIDRWREIASRHGSRVYLDAKTFDDTRTDSAKLWIKQARGSSDVAGPHSVEEYELNCGARQIRTVAISNYDASGNVTGSREGGKWESVIPDTMGETLLSGACRSN
jgi:tetratricopeptide (TPR) repeat protein